MKCGDVPRTGAQRHRRGVRGDVVRAPLFESLSFGRGHRLHRRLDDRACLHGDLRPARRARRARSGRFPRASPAQRSQIRSVHRQRQQAAEAHGSNRCRALVRSPRRCGGGVLGHRRTRAQSLGLLRASPRGVDGGRSSRSHPRGGNRGGREAGHRAQSRPRRVVVGRRRRRRKSRYRGGHQSHRGSDRRRCCSRAECGCRESNEDAADWLASPEAGSAGEAYRSYLARHGHRAVREIELRQKEWSAAPAPLVESIRASVAARVAGHVPSTAARSRAVPIPLRLRPLVAFARTGVRSRERSKCVLVAATAKFKRAYRALAALLVAEGRLPDDDLVYFLTHTELGELTRADAPQRALLVDRASSRRRALPLQMPLEFPAVWQGAAEPITATPAPSSTRSLVGRPVSPVSCAGARAWR